MSTYARLTAGSLTSREAACQGWETCMKQDPTSIRRTQLFASTFGESVSGFFEAISFKAMVSCAAHRPSVHPALRHSIPMRFADSSLSSRSSSSS